MSGPDTGSPPGGPGGPGPGRMSDRTFVRLMWALPIILAITLAVVVLAGGAS